MAHGVYVVIVYVVASCDIDGDGERCQMMLL